MSYESVKCYIFAVDYENISDEFWNGRGGKIWEKLEGICDVMGYDHIDPTNTERRQKDWILVEKEIGELFEREFEKCDGWSSPDYPISAPHPIVIIHTEREPIEIGGLCCVES